MNSDTYEHTLAIVQTTTRLALGVSPGEVLALVEQEAANQIMKEMANGPR